MEQQIKELARYLKRHTVTRTSEARTSCVVHTKTATQKTATQLQEDLLQCCVQLGTKIEVYATLIGLLNVEDYNFVGGLLQLAASAYSEAWQELDVGKATALLRLLAALVPVHVLASTSVFALLIDTIKAGTDIATGTSMPTHTCCCMSAPFNPERQHFYFLHHVVHCTSITSNQ